MFLTLPCHFGGHIRKRYFSSSMRLGWEYWIEFWSIRTWAKMIWHLWFEAIKRGRAFSTLFLFLVARGKELQGGGVGRQKASICSEQSLMRLLPDLPPTVKWARGRSGLSLWDLVYPPSPKTVCGTLTNSTVSFFHRSLRRSVTCALHPPLELFFNINNLTIFSPLQNVYLVWSLPIHASRAGFAGTQAVWLHGANMLRRALHLIWCSDVTVLKFLIRFEQRTPYFHFALGLANDVASSDRVKWERD